MVIINLSGQRCFTLKERLLLLKPLKAKELIIKPVHPNYYYLVLTDMITGTVPVPAFNDHCTASEMQHHQLLSAIPLVILY